MSQNLKGGLVTMVEEVLLLQLRFLQEDQTQVDWVYRVPIVANLITQLPVNKSVTLTPERASSNEIAVVSVVWGEDIEQDSVILQNNNVENALY